MCKEIGFKKKQYLFFIKPYTENVIAVLGFGIYTHQMPGHVFVGPFVAVTYKDVEELFCKLCGIDNPVFDFTFLKQIGYVMPEDSFKEWDMVEGSDNTGVFEDLFKHIKSQSFISFRKIRIIQVKFFHTTMLLSFKSIFDKLQPFFFFTL